MNQFAKVFLSIFAAIIGLATISVLVSRKSRAPEAIGALSNGIARVVAAAVSPASAVTNGDLGTNPFTTPSI